MHKPQNYLNGFRCGVKESIAVSLAGGLFGFAFGVLALSSGLTFGQTSFMSAFVYAGVAQVISVGIIAHHSFAILPLLITTAAICARYFLMSATIESYFKKIPLKSLLLPLFILMDENWAMTVIKARTKLDDTRFLYGYFVGGGLLAYVVWIICTVLGACFSSYIHNLGNVGLDFVFTALFIALLVGSWRGKKELPAWVLAFAFAAFFKHFLPGNWYIVCSALIASTVGVFTNELQR